MTDFVFPLTQSEAFERTCKLLKLPVTRFETQTGSCLVQSRKLPLIGQFHLLSRGPTGQTADAISAVLSEVRRTLSGPLVVNAPAEAGKMGGLQIASGAELALIDLADEEIMRARLHQKWRNQLKKAERSPVIITEQPLDATRHNWFLEAEAAQQTSRKYRSHPTGFLLAYAKANPGQARLYTASENGQPVAAMLILKHGRAATYQAGVTTDLGRKYCAHNGLLWKVMSDLGRRGFAMLDLGRSDLNPGLRRFKLGSGARTEQLGGSLLFHSWFAPRSKDLTLNVSGVM
ncbi:MAG: GNAT family N-acetyltransferase [Pseudomonadota bacterium]